MGQLPIGPSIGPAAAVLILGTHGARSAYATGRGEVLTPLTAFARVPLLLLLLEERVLTKDAFARIRRYSPALGIDAYRDFAAFTNDFEEPVFALLPRLRALKERLLDEGATWAQMSGSGSTIAAAFASEAERDAAQAKFTDVRIEAATTI